MLRNKTLASVIALAVVIGLSACGPDDRTAAVDETWDVAPDTAPLGVPGGTMGVPPDTLPTDPEAPTYTP